jgi:drug/metabolite transporter (DMT)-like permease
LMPPPSHFAISLILSAALLHALWNAVVKGSGDRAITIGLIAIGNALFGIVLAFFVEPPGPDSYVYIALTIAVHLLYFIFLIAAYKLGDFSLVYPIARGVAPLLVACGGMIFAGEYLSSFAWAGVMLVSVAITILVLAKGKVPSDPKAIGAALLTGCCIASYTIIDGLGVRASGSPLGYIGWSFGLQISIGIGFLIYRWDHLSSLPASAYLAGMGGGLISGLAYALAIYAMSLTSLGAVSAIRESSVIIAALIGAIWFGERPWKPRLFSAGLVAIGVYMLAQ